MLSMTYPMVGNYGVPAFVRDAKVPQVPRITFESEQIHASALVVQDYSATYSHWDAAQSLGERAAYRLREVFGESVVGLGCLGSLSLSLSLGYTLCAGELGS